jgi:hypothetical protein
MDWYKKNILLNLFLSQFGIEDVFINYAIKNGIDNYQDIINEFKSIQKNIFDYIWKITEPDKQLTSFEVEEECAMYCFENYQWINEIGLKALNNWLIWMCWHEGIIKK